MKPAVENPMYWAINTAIAMLFPVLDSSTWFF
jgi:hypothetical protein